MSSRSFVLLVGVGLTFVCGCSGPRHAAYNVVQDVDRPDAFSRASAALEETYPRAYSATHRAIITVGKKEFVCDGVLNVRPAEGHHLAVISTLGLVTEVRVTTNGTAELLRTTPLLPPAWSRNFVARDLCRLFVLRKDLAFAGKLADERLVLQSGPSPKGAVMRYIFSADGQRLEQIEVARGQDRLYLAEISRYRSFGGREMPAEFKITAPGYEVNLRTAEVKMHPGSLSSVAAP